MGKRDGYLKRQSKASGAQGQNNSPSSAPGNISNPQQRGIEQLALEKISEKNDVTVEGLVTEIGAKLGYKPDRIISKLIQLQSEGKIRIVEGKPSKSLGRYSISTNSLWFWGSVMAVVLSVISIYITSGFALYLRYLLGGLLILFLPGYSLVEFLFARKQDMEDSITRMALSIGLSLAIVPLVGLVLNFTPFGIRLIPIALSLAVLTIALLSFGLAKKHRYYKMLHDI